MLSFSFICFSFTGIGNSDKQASENANNQIDYDFHSFLRANNCSGCHGGGASGPVIIIYENGKTNITEKLGELSTGRRFIVLGAENLQTLLPNATPISRVSTESAHHAVLNTNQLFWFEKIDETRLNEIAPSQEESVITIKIFTESAGNEIQITASTETEQTANVQIFNVNGQVVYSGKKQLSAGLNEWNVSLDIQNNNRQMYFAVFTSESGKKVVKFMH